MKRKGGHFGRGKSPLVTLGWCFGFSSGLVFSISILKKEDTLPLVKDGREWWASGVEN